MDHANTSSTEKALLQKNSCSDTINERTRYIGVRNETGYKIVIAFFQLFDRSQNVPPGFGKETPVFVGITNSPGPSENRIDPCIPCSIPVQATRVEGAVKVVWPATGKEYDLNVIADDGDLTTYYDHVIWPLVYGPSREVDGSPIPTLLPIKKAR